MNFLIILLCFAMSVNTFQWRCQDVPESEMSSDENGKPFCTIVNLTDEHLKLGETTENSSKINLLLNQIRVHPQDLWIEDYFSNVDYLAICNTNFSDIPVMPEVQSLAIITVNFSRLIIGSGVSYRLEVLRLWGTSMQDFPTNMSHLSRLRSIEGESNCLKTLDFSLLSGLHNLKLIAFKSGHLSSLVLGSVDLPKLTRLDLSSNLFTKIPDGLTNLAALETLQLPGNRIAYVEMNRFDGMTTLKNLDLSNNLVTQIFTIATVHLPALEQIWLQNCNLKYLDVLHWDMPMLKKLDVQMNDLKEVVNLEGRFQQNPELVISGNDWYCSWLDSHENVVSFDGGIENEDHQLKCIRSLRGICCRESV